MNTRSSIRHTVAFSLKFSNEDRAVQTFFDAAKKLAAIPGVEHFECLQQRSKKNAFQFGLSMEFASRELYDAYNAHPDHAAFIQQYWVQQVTDFMETDYQLMVD